MYIDMTGVIASTCALSMNGLTTSNENYLNVYKIMYGINTIQFTDIMYVNTDIIDYSNTVSIGNDLWLPTAERAIVDNIRYDYAREEGILLESIQSYIINNNGNLNKLFEVSDFYGIPREEMDYWIKESEEWELA